MIDKILREFDEKAIKSIDFFKQSLSRLRTGRASAALLDGIKVEYYGQQTPIKQLANVTTPEARLINVQAWDQTAIPSIEKAILKSDLGLTPIIDGKIVRINIPTLTEERRKDLVKHVKKLEEECKVSLRQFRREANEGLDKLEKDKQVTEDDNRKTKDKVQKNLDAHIKKLEEVTKMKETEIMEV